MMSIPSRDRITERWKRATFGFAFALLIATSTATVAVAQESGSPPPEGVSETDYGTIDLVVQDTDLGKVLEMLSIQSKKNIVASRNVSATVTANLYDVTFEEALDSILRVNNYGYLEEGNFIYVYTIPELEAIESAKKKTDSVIYELYYLSAADADSFIQPLLSPDGAISYVGDVIPGFKPEAYEAGAEDYAFSAKLVITDYPENLKAITEVLQSLDIAPKQVLVEAAVLQTTVKEDNAFGIDFSVIGDLSFLDLANPLSAVTDLVNGSAGDGVAVTTSVSNKTQDRGGLQFGIVENNFAVFLRVLDKVRDTTILARPKIMCLNRQRARVHVGRRLGYLTQTQTQTSTSFNVEFLDTGVDLTFRPFIAPNDMIRMEIRPSISEGDVVTEKTDTSIASIPNEVQSEITTNVRVRDGHTLVLGGLFAEDTSIERSQVPVVGDIPVIGDAFKGQDDQIQREEIIFLLTPTIVRDEVLWEMGEDSLHLVDAVSVGARAGLLPFSREQITANYNEDAWGAYQRGDLDLALYYANNSLRLQKSQPDIHHLRAKIGGEKVDGYERGILHRMIERRFSAAAEADGNEVEVEEIEVEAIPDADSSSDASSPVAETETHASQPMTDTKAPQFTEEVTSMNEGVADSVATVDGEAGMQLGRVVDEDASADQFAPELARFLNGVMSNQAMETDSAPVDPFLLDFSEFFDADFEVIEAKADSKSKKDTEADKASVEVVADAASDKDDAKEEPIEVAEVEVDDMP